MYSGCWWGRFKKNCERYIGRVCEKIYLKFGVAYTGVQLLATVKQYRFDYVSICYSYTTYTCTAGSKSCWLLNFQCSAYIISNLLQTLPLDVTRSMHTRQVFCMHSAIHQTHELMTRTTVLNSSKYAASVKISQGWWKFRTLRCWVTNQNKNRYN